MSGGIVVFAYSEVGHACLDFLLRRGERIEALFTHEDAPGEELWFGSCATLAADHGVPVYRVEPSDGPEVERIVAGIAPSLIFSFYYRRMIPMAILAHATLGAFNMHGSLLPKYRGRAPVNWAVLRGEREAGVTLHVMAKRADAGDIVDAEPVPIGPDETAGEVMEKLGPAAVRLLDRRIDALKEGRAPRFPQDETQASYFGGRRPEDGRIDWAAGARDAVNLVRAVAWPYPGAFTEAGGRKLMVWRARVSDGCAAARGDEPGTVLGVDPLLVTAGPASDGAVEISRFGWEGEPHDGASAAVRAALTPGMILGTKNGQEDR